MILSHPHNFMVNEILREKKGFISIDQAIDINPTLQHLLEKHEGIILVTSLPLSFPVGLKKSNKIIYSSRYFKHQPTNFKKILFLKRESDRIILSFTTFPDKDPPSPESFGDT